MAPTSPWRDARQTLTSAPRSVSHSDDAKHRPTEAARSRRDLLSGHRRAAGVAATGGAALLVLVVAVAMTRGGSQPPAPTLNVTTSVAAESTSPLPTATPAPFPVENRPEGRYVARGTRTALVPAGYPGIPARQVVRFQLGYDGCSATRCRGTLGGQGPAFTWDGSRLEVLPRRTYVQTGRCVEDDGSLSPPGSTATWRTTLSTSDVSVTAPDDGGLPMLRYSVTETLRYIGFTGGCALAGDEFQYSTYQWTAAPAQGGRS